MGSIKLYFILLFSLLTTSIHAEHLVIDESFADSSGFLYVGKNGENWGAVDIDFLSNGRMILLHRVRTTDDVLLNVISCHLHNGELDTSFGDRGLTYLNPNIFGQALAINQNNDIYIGGLYKEVGNDDLAVVKLNQFGKIDSLYGLYGDLAMAKINLGSKNDQFCDLEIDPHGRLLIAATTFKPDQELVLLRLLESGVLDKNFGSNGKVQEVRNHGVYKPSDFIVHSNSAITVIGSNSLTKSAFAIQQYDSSGRFLRLKSSLHLNSNKLNATEHGVSAVHFNSELIEFTLTGTLLDEVYGTYRPFALRLNAYLDLDTSFGENGVSTFASPFEEDVFMRTSIIEKDGSILFVGHRHKRNPFRQYIDFLSIRFLSDGTLDDNFGTNGYLSLKHDGTHNYAQAAVKHKENVFILGTTMNPVWHNVVRKFSYTPGKTYPSPEAIYTRSNTNFFLYPNPAVLNFSMFFNLPTSESISVELRTIGGELLMEYMDEIYLEAGDHNLTFNLPDGLEAGKYLVYLQGEQFIAPKILIVSP